MPENPDRTDQTDESAVSERELVRDLCRGRGRKGEGEREVQSMVGGCRDFRRMAVVLGHRVHTRQKAVGLTGGKGMQGIGGSRNRL